MTKLLQGCNNITMSKQFDLYISNYKNSTYLSVIPLTDRGMDAYHQLRWQCLEAGLMIDEIAMSDRKTLVRNLNKAGFSVTGRLPINGSEVMTDDELLEALGV